MDPNDQAALDAAKREIEKYLNLPITRELVQDNQESQEKLLRVIVNNDVTDVETLVSHFVSIGHLRGLRDSYGSLKARLDEIELELANAPQ